MSRFSSLRKGVTELAYMSLSSLREFMEEYLREGAREARVGSSLMRMVLLFFYFSFSREVSFLMNCSLGFDF